MLYNIISKFTSNTFYFSDLKGQIRAIKGKYNQIRPNVGKYRSIKLNMAKYRYIGLNMG